jgi:CBS domain containing-hemolysin-like protein
MAKDNPEKFCSRAYPILRILLVVLSPLHWFFGLFSKAAMKMFRTSKEEGITEEELITMVEEAESEGGLEAHESELIRAAIEFNDMEVEEILTPRVDIVAAPDTINMEDLTVLFAESGYSRIPIYHGSIDNIIGVIHEKDFFSARFHNHTDLKSLIGKVFYTTATAQISDLLRLLQIRKCHMAVVVDDYGGTMGIVTLEDILEELVGEIWDEHDEIIEEFKAVGDNIFHIDGIMNFEDFCDEFDIEAESQSISVGGWATEQLERIPEIGDSFNFKNLCVTVSDMDVNRVSLLEIKILSPEEMENSLLEETTSND